MMRTTLISRPIHWLLTGWLIAAGHAASVTAQEKRDDEGGSRVELESIDGVYLTGRYWSPKGANRDTPVVLLLHPRGGSQREWYAFARILQEGKLPGAKAEDASGYAVLTIDFRGHGESKAVDREVYRSPRQMSESDRRRSAGRSRRQTDSTDSARRRAQAGTIDEAEEFRTGRDLVFLANDIEAAKDFLIKENNAGRLNIRRFGIIAAGPATSAVALTWLGEFEFRAAEGGFVRQGRDVASVALLSPGWGYQGLRPVTTLGRDTDSIPMVVVSGATSKTAADAGRVARAFRLRKIATESPPAATPKAADKPPAAEKAPSGQTDKKPKPADETKRPARGRSDFHREGSGWVELKTASEGLTLLAEGGASWVLEFLKTSLRDPRGLAWERRDVDSSRGGFGAER